MTSDAKIRVMIKTYKTVVVTFGTLTLRSKSIALITYFTDGLCGVEVSSSCFWNFLFQKSINNINKSNRIIIIMNHTKEKRRKISIPLDKLSVRIYV